MLLEGDYVTIISHHQVRHELDNGTLVTLPIALPDSARAIGLTLRKSWKPTPTQEVFLDIVKATATQIGQS
jgi:LysR family transcriptional regulator of gallate degradation